MSAACHYAPSTAEHVELTMALAVGFYFFSTDPAPEIVSQHESPPLFVADSTTDEDDEDDFESSSSSSFMYVDSSEDSVSDSSQSRAARKSCVISPPGRSQVVIEHWAGCSRNVEATFGPTFRQRTRECLLANPSDEEHSRLAGPTFKKRRVANKELLDLLPDSDVETDELLYKTPQLAPEPGKYQFGAYRQNIRATLGERWENVRTNVRTNVQTNVRTNVRTNVQTNVQTNIRTNVRTNVQTNVRTNIPPTSTNVHNC